MEQAAVRTVRVIPASRTRTKAGTGNAGTKKRERLRVAAYCRVSTDSEEQLNSYAAQKAYYTQLINDNPEWEMAGIFADEGISGTSTKKRTEFNKMIAACKRGRIDMILTKSISRFSRNTLDCLKIARSLKDAGIGVIFEKENINTLTQSSEFLLTLFGGFAQAESESLSKNVLWGKQKSMEAGNVPFHYKRILGYRRGADGNPEIDPDEARTVRWIYRRYLDGVSLGVIQRELEADAVLTAEGIHAWSRQVIKNILTNERYIGDALLQKTYVSDPISKRLIKNNGERPMYYIENHHEAIVPREVFRRVQEEMSRRASKRKIMQKSAKTEQGKYSGKYALSELLFCGECGSHYKRCTWSKNGTKRIVWRCVNRLEYGKKFCHYSPTLDEDRIQDGVLTAFNRLAADREELTKTAMELAGEAIREESGQDTGIPEVRRRLERVAEEQEFLLEKVLEDMDNPEWNARLESLSEEKKKLQERMEAFRREEERKTEQASRLRKLREWLDQQPLKFTEYDDTLTRKIVERITVVNEDMITVKIRDMDEEMDVRLRPRK